MTQRTVKSVITCDLEGRIETFNEGAAQIFGYAPEEVIGKKRVSIFSPGLVVLGHVGNWLKAAREQGEWQGRTVFLKRDGTPFVADIRITPTFREGKQIGYCGVTTPRYDIPVEEAMPKIGFMTRLFRWVVITRAPFLTATLIPLLVGAAWAAASGRAAPFPWLLFALALLGGVAMHVAANVFNDYFDWRSGTDPLNNDYFQPLSGGSRAVELGLISEQGLFRVASVALLVAAAIGGLLAALGRPALILFGLFGAFSVFFYTAPPLRLAARRGLGELFVGLNFGPLMTAGMVYTLTGAVGWSDFFIGLPMGLLITAILWINEFPDLEADRAGGKVNLVVVLGRSAARWGYLLLVGGAFALVVVGVLAGALPLSALLMLAALPIAVYTTVITFRHYADRSLVRANAWTINLLLLAGVLLALGVYLSPWIGRVLPL